MKTKRAVDVMVYLFLGFFAAIIVIPYVWVLLGTFKNKVEVFSNPFGLPEKWLFSNYVEAWTIGRFGQYYINTVVITLLSVGIVLCSVIPAGYAFAKMDFYGGKILLYMLLLGLIIPFYSIMIPLYYILRNFHLLDTYMGMVFPLVALHIPFGVFLMRSFFVSIPSDLLDAARVDGCSELGVFTRIVIPMAQPAVSSLAIFQTVWSWNNFIVPLLYTQSDWIRPITLGLMYFEGRYTTDYRLTMTGCIIVSMPLLIVFLIFQKRFVRGFIGGAFK